MNALGIQIKSSRKGRIIFITSSLGYNDGKYLTYCKVSFSYQALEEKNTITVANKLHKIARHNAVQVHWKYNL